MSQINDVDDGDRSLTIHLGPAESDDPGFDGIDPVNPVILIVDDDTAGIHVGDVSGNTDETGQAATFTVVLQSKPTEDVDVAVASDDPGEGEVATDTLIFTPDNWAAAQTVTVTGVNDDEEDGPVDYAIVLTSSSADPNYDGVPMDDVMITNADDDNIQTSPGTDDSDQGGDGGGGGGGCFIGTMTRN